MKTTSIDRLCGKPASQCLAIAMALGTGSALAQQEPAREPRAETAREAQGTETAAPASARSELSDYTVKSGDFRLLVSTSLGLDWNDNINASRTDAKQDVILKPMLNLAGTYPLTKLNALRFNVSLGYDYYFDHTDYSGLRLLSGSELSFDLYVEDLLINFHERAAYTQDSAGQSALANAGRFGGFDNTVGFSLGYELEKAVLSLGYDHQNFVSSTSQYEYLDRASEQVNLRGGLRLHPSLVTGAEGLVSFTDYEHPVLNNNIGYNVGLYADWRLGKSLHVQPRVGYTLLDFDQTSYYIPAENQDAWYASLSVNHEVTEAISYGLTAGHELRLGMQADSIEDWYLRPSVTWKCMKDVSLNSFVSYEHGTQGSASQWPGVSEDYDWLGLGWGVKYSPTRQLSVDLSYRLTLRSSDVKDRGYSQNLVGVQLSYTFQ